MQEWRAPLAELRVKMGAAGGDEMDKRANGDTGAGATKAGERQKPWAMKLD